MSHNPGLPQNAPWVPASQLVSPHQVIANPPGRFAARRGGLTRLGARPRLRGATAQAGSCPPLPPGCRQIYGWPRCTVDCGPVPKDPRLNNPTPLVWGAIGLGAAALAGGGYYLWQRAEAAELAEATGITVDGDCTKLTVTNQETALVSLSNYIDAAVEALGDNPISTLVVGASYLNGVAPSCGVSVTEDGIQGVDTWQKAAMVGGMAILISGTLHDDGRMNDAVFKEQAEDVQAFLLERGVQDLAMIEDVFEMPEGTDASQAGGGFAAGGTIGTRQANLGGLALALLGGAAGFVFGGLLGTGVGAGAMMPKVLYRDFYYADEWMYEKIVIQMPWMPVGKTQYIGVVMGFPPGTELTLEGFAVNRATDTVWRNAFESEAEALAWVTELQPMGGEDRQANIGGLGIAALGLGAAAAATGGYLWWRNREVAEACIGDAEWLEADGSLSETAEGQLEIAMQEAIADGKQNAMDVADAAIIKVSGNPDCRLPNLIWGDLLRIRASAIAMAAILIGGEELRPGTAEGPGPAVTGIEANATCDQLVIHDRDLSEAYFDEWMVEMGAMEGMTWVPNPVMMGAGFLQRVAPHCGVSVSDVGTPEILGVNTPQKAVMVGAFAINVSIALFDLGVITEDETNAQGAEIMEWLAQHGVDDMMAMAEEVIIVAGDTGFGTHPSPNLDDWEEPLANTMVAKGSVGGDPGGMWRVYQDKVGEYQGGYYFKVWSQGEYVETGVFQTAKAAEEAAIDWIVTQPQQAGIQQNPRRARRRMRRAPRRAPLRAAPGEKLVCGGDAYVQCYCKKWSHPQSIPRICLKSSCRCVGPLVRNTGIMDKALAVLTGQPARASVGKLSRSRRAVPQRSSRSLKGCIAALEKSCTTYHAKNTKGWKKCMSTAIGGCIKAEGPFAESGSGIIGTRSSGKLARRMRARNATLLLPAFEISKPTRVRRVRNAATAILKPSRKTNCVGC